MRTIQYGGQLEKGDFLCISYTNWLVFGWYIGDGSGNSLQFYGMGQPASAKKSYDDYLIQTTKPSPWLSKRYKNGFGLKQIYKDFLISTHDQRFIKINPRDVFTRKEDIEIYEKSREVLIDLNFIER